VSVLSSTHVAEQHDPPEQELSSDSGVHPVVLAAGWHDWQSFPGSRVPVDT
jgi:hypothetical protein